MRDERKRAGWLLAALALLAALLLLATPAAGDASRMLRRGQRAPSLHSDDAATDVAVSHVAARRSAMERVSKLRLRAHAAAEGGAVVESALGAGASSLLQAAAQLPYRMKGRGAGGKAGRAGGKAGVAAGNAGQSGRKAGDAAGNGGQSGRKAGDAAGNGGQSGRKAGDAAGNGGQSGRKAGDASGNGGQSGRKAGDASGNGGQSGRKAGDTGSNGGQSGRKAGDLPPVSPVIGSAPPDSSNVITVTGVKRNWPVQVYLRNQGDAATCWAHSAVTLLELRQQMGLVSSLLKGWYSVDQVVKCVPNDGAAGGNPLDAIAFLLTADLLTDAQVRAGKNITCNKYNGRALTDAGHFSPLLVLKPCVTPGENCSRMRDYEAEMERQYSQTPMLAYVDASQWSSYAPRFSVMDVARYAKGTAADYSGVAFPTNKCSMDPVKGDHLVILLGTVTCPKTKQKYWRAYNSWGKEWGVNGYIYLPFEQNACGLANYPVGLAQSGRPNDFLDRSLLMIPKGMTAAQAAATPEFKQHGRGLVGGIREQNLWITQVHGSRTQLAK